MFYDLLEYDHKNKDEVLMELAKYIIAWLESKNKIMQTGLEELERIEKRLVGRHFNHVKPLQTEVESLMKKLNEKKYIITVSTDNTFVFTKLNGNSIEEIDIKEIINYLKNL